MQYKTWFLLFFLGIVAAWSAEGALLQFSSERTAFYRDENPRVALTLTGEFPSPSVLEVWLGERSVYRGAAEAGVNAFVLPTAEFASGKYEMTAQLRNAKGEEIATRSIAIELARRPSADALQNWLWMNGSPGLEDQSFYKEHGFDFVQGPMLPYSEAKTDWERKAAFQKMKQLFNDALTSGMRICIVPNGGLWEREFGMFKPEGEDVRYVNAARHGEKYYNPFSPLVAEKQNEANRMFMEAAKDYPNVTMAWTDMENQDDVTKPNLNREGREKMEKELGFTEAEVGEPSYVDAHVIRDDDRGYRLFKYVFTGGNGVTTALQRMVDVVKEYRPDMLTMTDPYRHTALYDVYPSVDMIHSWTYTNPDPKAMVYIEQLRAVCKPRNQIPLQVVTLLNYPGMLDVPKLRENPPDKDDHARQWMGMGPDRVKETTWINLSRAPQFVGYFYGSEIDPVKYADEPYRIPPETSDAIGEMAEKVFRPYGKMIRKLDVSPRKAAVLVSQVSALYSNSPNSIEGSYAGYRSLPFQIVLEMAHYNADVLFDESIAQGALDGYDVLFLPRIDTLSQSVYEKIQAFQKRGGLIFSDQYLGPKLNVDHQFDFDFSYRSKVSAQANAMGVAYADWDDHATKNEQIDLKKVLGVPAHKDQEVMEGYAKTLKEVVGAKVPHVVDADEPTVLFNLTEKYGVKYLFVINDKRAYDERIGKFMGMMEKGVPQTVNVRYRDPEASQWVVYDMLTQKELPVKAQGEEISFPVELDSLGGKMIALYPSRLKKLAVSAKTPGKRGEPCTVSVDFQDAKGQPVKGLQPVRVDLVGPAGNLHEDSDWICLENGKGTLVVTPAWDAPAGNWQIKVKDLTAGLTAQTSLTLK